MTQEERCKEAKAQFLQLHERARRKLRENGVCPEGLWMKYQSARAAFLIAQGALDEEFSIHEAGTVGKSLDGLPASLPSEVRYSAESSGG